MYETIIGAQLICNMLPKCRELIFKCFTCFIYYLYGLFQSWIFCLSLTFSFQMIVVLMLKA